MADLWKGHWISVESTKKGQKFACSVCRKIAYYPQPTRSKDWVKHCGYRYCPNCSADMRGVNNG